jgi:hypothetical protein
MRRGLMAAAAVVALTAMAWYPATADAATSWTIQAVPVPAGAQAGSLGEVSCFSADSCMAFGFSQKGPARTNLTEFWNGSAWTIQHTASPPGATGYGLSAGSCTSASSCTAVGSMNTGSQTAVPLAEHWDGSTWTVQSTPSPTGPVTSSLSAVSCVSASSCVAVGVSQDSNSVIATLAERWNGSAWTLLNTVSPPSQFGSGLQAVSCTSATSCMATGFVYSNSAAEKPLAERWDGSTWTLLTAQAGDGAQNLGSVSCTSPANCTAVGTAETSVFHPLAEHWNGTGWAIQKVPAFAGSVGSSWLTGVSCTSASSCAATGGGYRKRASVNALSYNWNGHAWAARPTATPAAAKLLTSVSCTSAGACMAVGNTTVPRGNGVGLPLAENR